MNGDKLVLDTNAVIDYLNGVDAATRFIGERLDAELLVSVVTRMELLSYRHLDDEGEAAIHRFLGAITVIPLRSHRHRPTAQDRREIAGCHRVRFGCMGESLTRHVRKPNPETVVPRLAGGEDLKSRFSRLV